MEYYAHSKEIDGETIYQSIIEHAEGVSKRMILFSAGFCEESFAKSIAFLHDVGKYQEDFQQRIKGKNIQVSHAICGAREWKKFNLPDAAAYVIAGHHAGLSDRGNGNSPSTLSHRLEREETDVYNAYQQELQSLIPDGNQSPYKNAVSSSGETAWKEYAFWIRMMFSCLVDADFLDTEEFCSDGGVDRGLSTDFENCLKLLKKRLLFLQSHAVTATEKARSNLQKQVLSHKNENANFYYMNMPTGSGKTLTSMLFALERLIAAKKKRIIYVIPYTSIIDQNAKVFKDLFGEECILEHHCNFDYDTYDNLSTREKVRRSAENWDAPIVITTNVQFFESIYSNRPSKLRKLHNLADSILIFDEAHMLPSGYFQPCLEAIKILTTRYGCEAIFLTATMPDFDKWLKTFQCDGVETCNLIDDTACFGAFKRSKVENLGEISQENILDRVMEYKNALVVVNSRKTAKALYNQYSGKKYHLSTYMNHSDRDRVIANIKKSLAEGEEFCLFSTSLIEAGVDLDFNAVFRERAGLDNLLQTAGRCNRSGKKEYSECRTYSFSLEDQSFHKTMGDLKTKQYYTQKTFEQYEDITAPEAIRFYFNKLYDDEKTKMNSNNFLYAKQIGMNSDYSKHAKMFKINQIFDRISYYNFAGYADAFRMIDDHTKPLLIINSDNREDVEALLNSLKYADFGRNIYRKLQKYMISLRPYEWDVLQKLGAIQTREGIDCLANENYYHPETGICFEDNTDYIF